jgi:hypothetical protein
MATLDEVTAAMTQTSEARTMLAKAGMDSVIAVPTDQMADLYARFLRLSNMGQATVDEWLSMDPGIAALRHAIFAQSDFGALHAGQWLPHEVRSAVRENVKKELAALRVAAQ